MTRTIILSAILMCLTISTNAQLTKDSYYWVLESNIKASDSTVLKIYNQHNDLVKEVWLHAKINILKQKHRRHLDRLAKRSVRKMAHIANKPINA